MNNQSNKHILKALKIADILMGLANNESAVGSDNSCDVLFGVMRDCAYKIRHQVEREARRTKGRWGPCILQVVQEQSFSLKKSMMVLAVVLILGAVTAGPVKANIILSTDMTETLGGLTFGKGDLAEYNPTTDTATLYLDGSLFGGPSDIDATHILGNGNIILSTVAGATLGGLTFSKGDLVEYNPTTDTATLYFDETLFTSIQPNIDTAYVDSSGNIILSTTANATLGGLSFGKDDLIEYNPTTDTSTLYFDGALFSASNEDVDVAHVLSSGNIVFSTIGGATLGGLSFGAGDLVEYNPITDTSTLYFDENLFSSSANIDAVYVTHLPEPATIALLGFGSLVLMRRRRK
jgi:hypothetical protein